MINVNIAFDERTGNIAVSGEQLHNKLLTYGILELAKDAIREQEASNIIRPSGGMQEVTKGPNGHTN